MQHKISGVWLGIGLVLSLAACGGSSPQGSDTAAAVTPAAPAQTGRSASIRWTRFGIPHIKADNWDSLSYGVGYAFANDNLCTLAEDIMTTAGERSKYFGPDGEHGIIGSFFAGNRDSDFFFKFVVTDEVTQRFIDAASATAKEAVSGYVAGYNRYVRELRAGDHPGRHALCASEPWVRELTDNDLYKRFIRLAILASSGVFRTNIARSQPPGSGALPPSPVPIPGIDALFGESIPFGSNMYALGADATDDGSTYVFGNPHFPWYGPERLHAFHITIPGEVDSMGVGLYGTPVPLIGFNDRFGWSHTVSEAYRFSFYELDLVPGAPTTYRFDNGTRQMTSTDLSIEVMQPDGSIATESRTLYRSHYGPILFISEGVLDWTAAKAYTLRDANLENTRLIEQFLQWNKATDLADFKRLHGEILGVPWVNTVAAGANQPVYYGDVTVVPNVPNAMIDASAGGTCAAEPAHTVVNALVPRIPVLNGSRPDCAWRDDADSPQPGIFGPANLPKLERTDWVHNCNDSYWQTNPAEPVTGFARIIGDEGAAPRSLRTRLCIQQIVDRLAGTDGLAGNRFNLTNLQDIVLSARILSAEQDRDRVISDICPNSPLAATDGASIDITQACMVLDSWDTKAGVESRGALIWREFFRRVRAVAEADRYQVTYSSADPVNTPRDLNTGNADIQTALADAVQEIQNSGLALDTRLGDVQYDVKNGEQIELFGGTGRDGEFTIAVQYADRPHDTANAVRPALDANGFPLTTYGNSWVYTQRFPPTGRMEAYGYITYSQSDDPASPHYSDYTKAYANKEWPRLPFFEDEVEAATTRELELTE